jgi:hypothetical protein
MLLGLPHLAMMERQAEANILWRIIIIALVRHTVAWSGVPASPPLQSGTRHSRAYAVAPSATSHIYLA